MHLKVRMFSTLRLVVITATLLLSLSVLRAAVVPMSEARLVADHFILELQHRGAVSMDGDVVLVSTMMAKEEPLIYVYDVSDLGFILISAEDEVYPILGYSLNGNWCGENPPSAFSEWIQSYKDQILYIRSEGLRGTYDVEQAWMHYRQDHDVFMPETLPETSDVGPLLTCRWNQNTWYNYYCPLDPDGPGGRALAGCVATAMGQVMYYYRYPHTGTGTSTYYHHTYGHLSANHGNTTFRWDEMGDLAWAKGYDAIAELLYHLGVSVNMNYGPNASGAQSTLAAQALRTRFNYDQSLTLAYKNSYSDFAWVNLIRSNLDAGHPMYYHGFGSGGHAFNVDGYQGNHHFHFNWGWGGMYDGYFIMGNLNPGTHDFTSGQAAIINFKPPSASYPSYCSPSGTQVLTALTGSLEDGSGPVLSYQHYANCSWRIEPTGSVSHIDITFRRFHTESQHDVLYIYDGINQQAPLLAVLSGDSVPPTITTTGGAAFLHFETNSTIAETGWMLTYEGYRPSFCSSIQTFHGWSGTFDDGSGPGVNYNINTNCRFHIQTGHQNPVKLSFNYFSIEDGKDFLRVYDPTTVPTTLLATLTGHSIPADIIAPNGQAMLIFYSNNGDTYPGWEVSYSSVVGVDEVPPSNFSLYPNPAGNTLIVRFEEGSREGTIVLQDLTGRQVRTYPLYGDGRTLHTLDLSGITSGIYIVSLKGVPEVKPQRLVIRN